MRVLHGLMSATAAGPNPDSGLEWSGAPRTREPKRQRGACTVRLSGGELLTQLRQDLGQLSPRMDALARYCLEHHSDLHLQRITQVAQCSGAIPSTVVRFAKQYGYSGFSDFKFAFLNKKSPDGTPGDRVADKSPDGCAIPARFTAGIDHAELNTCSMWEETGDTLEHWLKFAPRIWMVGSSRMAPLASLLLDGWRHQGRQVTWRPCEPQTLSKQALKGVMPGDLVVWLHWASEVGAPLAQEFQLNAKVCVVSVGMRKS
jgi:DNA-binding MurR/RpiR family transcriptional regulator